MLPGDGAASIPAGECITPIFPTGGIGSAGVLGDIGLLPKGGGGIAFRIDAPTFSC